MKKIIAGAAVAGTLFAGAYAFAANLTVDSDDLAAGTSSVAACQASAVAEVTDVNYDVTSGEYLADKVTVTFPGANCDGQSIEVTLAGAANAYLDDSTGTVNGTSAELAFTGVQADAVTRIAVVVTGDQPTP